ncbi:MAG: discoidin domain-containing protein [Clostridia bacterium]|nr:discoidin domain-containing protein [Clostridia bacterium]
MKHLIRFTSLFLCLFLIMPLSVSAGEEEIARGKPAASCHVESSSLTPALAVDGNESTRFAAGGGCTNDTWFIVDFGDVYDVSRVSILWETAHPSLYTLELSVDGVTFTKAAEEQCDESGTVRKETRLSGSGRFLRISEQARREPAYGFSIFDLQVFGTRSASQTNHDDYVIVTAGDTDGGTLRLSAQGFVKKGTTIMVNASPSGSNAVGSIKAGNTDLPVQNGSASFTADTDCTVSAVFVKGASSRFECEDVPVYADMARSSRLSMVRGEDAHASGKFVAGGTGGKWFLFENVTEANCIHVAYASPNTNSMKLALRYPGETDFTLVGSIPFSTSNSWYMDSSYTASSPILWIPAGCDVMISPNVDCNLDYMYLTNDAPDAKPGAGVVTADQMSDKAVTDTVSPFGKALSLSDGQSVTFTVPDGKERYNVISLTVCTDAGGTFTLARDGNTIAEGDLPVTTHRAYTGTGVISSDYHPGERLTLTVHPAQGNVLLSHLTVNKSDLPLEPLVIDGMPDGGERLTVSLNGTWAVCAEPFGTWNVPKTVPDLAFINSMPVPGLWHSAAFDLGSYASQKLWLQRTVKLEEEPTGTVLLEIGSAQYGRYIYVNGKYAGEYVYNYSRSLTDLTGLLHKGENTITVMLGEWAQQFNDKSTAAHVLNDGESTTNKPGITDAVRLIFTGAADVSAVQTAQDVDKGTVTVQAILNNRTNQSLTTDVTVELFEMGVFTDETFRTGAWKKVGERVLKNRTVPAGKSLTVRLDDISLADWSREKCWTPDNPFLYMARVSTAGDTYEVRFGMRTFEFDDQGNARLNGEIICLMGTNVAIERFFDDPLCLNNPWDEDWIRKLYSEYRDCHWFCFRTHLGSANSLWFDIADEMGFMIFDEYANWGDNDGCTVQSIMPEIRAWIDERGHHPSVICFDAMNEGSGTLTDQFIPLGREYDIQHRPWDNGWNRPSGEHDSIECHPYVMGGSGISALQSFDNSKPLITTADIGWTAEQFASHPFILNEHGELWISREGQAMSGTVGFWSSLRANTSNEARNVYYADAMAAELECFRAGRAYTGILFFCGLGSSPVGAVGVTSDILSPDVSTPESLCIRPYIKERLSDAFAPLGICLDYYTEDQKRGAKVTLPVVLINDTGRDVNDLPVTLVIRSGDTVLYADRTSVSVPAHTETDKGLGTTVFETQVPAYRDLCADKKELTVTVSYTMDGETVSSVRKWYVQSGVYSDDPVSVYDWLEGETDTRSPADTAPVTEPGTSAADTVPAETEQTSDTAPAVNGCSSALASGAIAAVLLAAAAWIVGKKKR